MPGRKKEPDAAGKLPAAVFLANKGKLRVVLNPKVAVEDGTRFPMMRGNRKPLKTQQN